MAKKAGTSLGLSIFLIIGVLVVLTTAAAIAAIFVGRGLTRDAIASDLRRVHSAQAVLLQKRHRELELGQRVVAGESWVADSLARASAGTDDATELRTRIEAFLDEQALDLFIFFDPQGRVVFRSGSALEPAIDADFASDPLFVAAQQGKSAAGIWMLADELYHAVALQLERQFEVQGYVALAASIVPLADELQRTTGADIVLFADSPTGPAVVASNLDAARAETVIAALRREGQALTRIKRSETVPAADLELDGAPWIAFLTPLRDAADAPVGATVGLVPTAARLAVYEQMQWMPLAAGGAALVLGFVLALVVAYRTFAPVKRLAAAAGELAGGNFEAEIPTARGGFAPLAIPLGLLARRLRDKEALESFLGQVGREIPEGGRQEVVSPPASRQLALVAVEMRRFANPKLGYDPEENVGRLARDLRRLQTSVAARQGTVEAVLGHRALALFEGEGRARRALDAAVEILQILTTRENAFDEPAPPVIALTQGSVVTGSVRWGSRIDTAVAGLPVQQLESLLREATPGEIYLAKPIAAELAETARGAGVELTAQRGLMSPQPLYQLSSETARRLIGAPPPEATRAPVPAQTLDLSDVVPGEVLGGRFEILAELGSGPAGAVFKSRDRERGNVVRLKILESAVAADAERLERLRQSLEQARIIAHPNILGVLDFGQIDGLAFITSPLVRGMSLRFVIDGCRQVPLRPAFLLARQIAEGLRAALRQKLVHGGLRPENVLVEPAGTVLVTDFGHTPPVTPLTRDVPYPGAVYLAPEQIDGRQAGPRADVYAWGAVVYEMVTGRPPAAGTTANAVSFARVDHGLEPPSALVAGLPTDLEAILLRSLEVSPRDRYGSIDELAQELDALRE